MKETSNIKIFFLSSLRPKRASLGAHVVMQPSACSVDLGSIPDPGRFPRKVIGYPLQYSCPENSMDTAVWWATIHGVTTSQTWLRDQRWRLERWRKSLPVFVLLLKAYFEIVSFLSQSTWKERRKDGSVEVSLSLYKVMREKTGQTNIRCSGVVVDEPECLLAAPLSKRSI